MSLYEYRNKRISSDFIFNNAFLEKGKYKLILVIQIYSMLTFDSHIKIFAGKLAKTWVGNIIIYSDE